ncbi:hypothetical protein Droror1_Dr00026953 [Drosera rotundifolia]
MPTSSSKPKWVAKNRGEDEGKDVVEHQSEVGSSRYGGGEGVEKEKIVNGGDEGGVDEGEEDVEGLVVRRLEELRLLGAEEVELTEEEWRINDQLQEDELLAMKSIYEENIYVLERWKGMRSFQIHIHVEISGELTVSAKFAAANNPKSQAAGIDDFLYSFKVQYLPPIVLTCLIPRTYPSHSPPQFTISIQWLNSARISSLCSMLDSLWKDKEGQEIMYCWVEWLQECSLTYLGFIDGVVLGPYGIENAVDKRAISGIISPDVDIPSMRSYNEEKRHVNFLNGFHECCICYSDYSGTEFVRLPCQHFFCMKCMKTYAEMHVKEGTVNKLHCPRTNCGGMVPPFILKRLLGDEEFDRWESLILQKTLDSMSDIAYCPRCETACIEDEENHAQCSKCYFSFCTLCRDRRHVGDQCISGEEKLRILQDRQNSAQIGDEQRRKEQELINKLRSVKEIFRDAKQCPSCKMAISRTEGCNKMVCQNCGEYFCYSCGKAIDGYDHFRGECELFSQAMIQQWEERINNRQLLAQVQVDVAGANTRHCPNCGQLNAKVGNNNHIFCWACQGHFCFLCRKVVRRASQHFGPKGCKQHTVDSTQPNPRNPR